jgi:hypothetical protein
LKKECDVAISQNPIPTNTEPSISQRDSTISKDDSDENAKARAPMLSKRDGFAKWTELSEVQAKKQESPMTLTLAGISMDVSADDMKAWASICSSAAVDAK